MAVLLGPMSHSTVTSAPRARLIRNTTMSVLMIVKFKDARVSAGRVRPVGFTRIELLVVVAIIAIGVNAPRSRLVAFGQTRESGPYHPMALLARTVRRSAHD